MLDGILGSVVGAVASSFLSTGNSLSRSSSSGTTGGYNPFTAAMAQRGADSLMSPIQPKTRNRRDSAPAQAVSNHPLSAYTQAFRG